MLIKPATRRVAGRSPAIGFIFLFVAGLKANCYKLGAAFGKGKVMFSIMLVLPLLGFAEFIGLGLVESVEVVVAGLALLLAGMLPPVRKYS